jgi:DNA-binding CsgD family transcriptional regulator
MAARTQHDAGLVARRQELSVVVGALRDPGCRGAVIHGAPGVGKTRLARAALEEAAAGGAAAHWVRATASAASIPLAAVVDLLPDHADAADPLRLFQASAAVLRERAAGRPLVVCVDDAHLLDPSSAALLLHLSASGSASILATVRRGARPPDAVTALWKDEGARRVELGNLAEPDAAELVQRLLGGPVERVAMRWTYGLTAGNPLYLRELVAEAVESGALAQRSGLWRLLRRDPIGPALSDLLGERLDGLGPRRLELLAAVALAEPLGEALLDGAGDPADVDALRARGLISVEAGAGGRVLRLAHPLYGEVALARVPEERLRALRVLLADAERERGGPSAGVLRVATWLRDADAPIDVATLLAAADEAYRSRDPALAADLAARSERQGGGPAAAIALGRALGALGRHADAEAALARVEGRLPSPEAALPYLFARINAIVWGLGRPADARALVARAETWWDDPAWRRRVAAMRLMVLSASGASQEAAALADELAAAPDPDPWTAGVIGTGGAIAWLHSGRTERARAASDRAVPAPPADERLDDRGLAALIAWALSRLDAGVAWDAVEERVTRIERAALARDDRLGAGPATGLLGHLALQRGRPATALRLLREAAAHLEDHDPRGLSVVILAQAAHAAALLGDVADARAAEAEALRRLRGREPAWHERPRLACAAAWIAAADGEPTRGARLLLETAAGLDPWPVLQAHVLAEALSLGAPAGQVAAPLAAAAARSDARLAAVAAARAQALQAREGAALAAAADDLEAIGAALAAAEALAQAAAHEAAAGRTAAARRAAARAERLLAGCEGATTPALRATRTARAGLTGREREIAGLAAAGETNAGIAERLTLSVRTVESHLYHAMTKLGVRRRDELAAALDGRAPSR